MPSGTGSTARTLPGARPVLAASPASRATASASGSRSDSRRAGTEACPPPVTSRKGTARGRDGPGAWSAARAATQTPRTGGVTGGWPRQAGGQAQRHTGGGGGPSAGHQDLREPAAVPGRRPAEPFGERGPPAAVGATRRVAGGAECRSRVVPTGSSRWRRRAWPGPEAGAATALRIISVSQTTRSGAATGSAPPGRPQSPPPRSPGRRPRPPTGRLPPTGGCRPPHAGTSRTPVRAGACRQRAGSQASSSVAWARTRCRRLRRVSASSGARAPSSSVSARSSGPSIRVSR